MKPASFVIDELLVHHVAKHLGQIRRNVSQFARFDDASGARRAMKIRIIGGGPAGLFFAYLMGRADAGHDIRVYERDPEGATYGWGLVFSDVALVVRPRHRPGGLRLGHVAGRSSSTTWRSCTKGST